MNGYETLRALRKEYVDRLAMMVMNPLVDILPLVAMNGYDMAMNRL